VGFGRGNGADADVDLEEVVEIDWHLEPGALTIDHWRAKNATSWREHL
jgi:hypothetical protein